MSGSAPPLAKRTRLEFDDIVYVIIGEKEKDIGVHRSILTRSSEFFAECCNDSARPTKTKSITLPDVEEDVFSVYLNWLYTGALVLEDDVSLVDFEGDDVVDKESTDEQKAALCAYEQLASLAILADQCTDVKFYNKVVDVTIKMLLKYDGLAPDTPQIEKVWLGLSQSSTMRELYMDILRDVDGEGWLEREKNFLEPTFVLDFMVSLLEERNTVKRPAVTWERRCEYHEHSDTVPSCSITGRKTRGTRK